MADLKIINCECGCQYHSKSFVSTCPNCNKQNWTAEGGLIVIGIIVIIAVLVGLMFGAIGWLIYSITNKLNKWHFIGVIAAGIFCLYFFNDMFIYKEYPIMSWITYLSNGSAMAISGYYLFQHYKNNNQQKPIEDDSAINHKKKLEKNQVKKDKSKKTLTKNENNIGSLKVSFPGQWFIVDAKTKLLVNDVIHSEHSTKKGFEALIQLPGSSLKLDIVIAGMRKTTINLNELDLSKKYSIDLTYDSFSGKYSKEFQLNEIE